MFVCMRVLVGVPLSFCKCGACLVVWVLGRLPGWVLNWLGEWFGCVWSVGASLCFMFFVACLFDCGVVCLRGCVCVCAWLCACLFARVWLYRLC